MKEWEAYLSPRGREKLLRLRAERITTLEHAGLLVIGCHACDQTRQTYRHAWRPGSFRPASNWHGHHQEP